MPDEDDRARREQPRHRRRHRSPVTSRITIPARTTSVRFAPGPSGTACRRTSAGWSTTSTSGSSRWYSSAPQVPCRSRRVADDELRLAGQVLALALDREHDEVAALRHHPGEDGLADQRRARRDDHLRDPRLPADERVGVVVERVLLDERPGEGAEVPRDRARPSGPAAAARRRGRRSRSCRRAAGCPTSANSKKPNLPTPASSADSETITLTGEPGEREQRAGMSPERERHQDLGRRHAQPDRHHGDDGQQGGDGAVDADQRRQHGDEQHHQDDQARPAVARPSRSVAARPRR